MKLATTILLFFAALLPSAVEAVTPYTCLPYYQVSYQAGVALQSAIVAKAANYGTTGVDLNANGKVCVGGTDTVNSGYTAAGACIKTKGSKTFVTAGQIQTAMGQLLSGCASKGQGGQIVLDNVVYGMYSPGKK